MIAGLDVPMHVGVRIVGDARDGIEDGAVARVEAREAPEMRVQAVLSGELCGLEWVVLIDRRTARRRVALGLHEDARQPRGVCAEMLLLTHTPHNRNTRTHYGCLCEHVAHSGYTRTVGCTRAL